MDAPEKKHTILIVEDEPAQLNVLSDAIQTSGFNTLKASDGPTGLKMALEHQPSLILLDNRMPQMSGYSMLRQIRAENNWGAKVPVIFFSNIPVSGHEEETDIADAGVAYYLMKSDTSLVDLIAKIRTAIGI